MNIAVMQPYVFPYLGYYQLVGAVDTFVFFDDVNYINKGWINRNRILQNNEPFRFTIPLVKASQNRLINEIEIAEYDKWRKDFLKLLELNYKKAPNFSFFYKWLEDFFYSKEYRLIGEITSDSVEQIAKLMNLPTRFLRSSDLSYKTEEKQNGQDKILSICDILKADQYINPKNGVEIYEEEPFTAKNIRLRFINMDDIKYHQFERDNFQSALSIIDVLMFVDVSTARELLNKYTLTTKIGYNAIS
ncbi:hypothetical protein FAM09_05390 [Niastella caeni]|uniref:WbqC family protein n=1 Tax=Niastella caeni TaxID=2569763 RepID=A0A4S8I1H3_9BACT|nr:WbqC family protein [Niastella caeni]THU41541.1 hypothetical protein FAM09_05390 [Niastella caeni]